ncbi:hypothetical protein [Paraburkholderia hospita]|uniref:hypothetical protein n=1 Tax=Paraburkholderia hospita TaxID=169430 RepID=UPI00115FE377|nr:hypothetical protein [Paraburkholderia hospita]
MNQIAYALNLAVVLCELGFETERERCVHRAQEWLMRLAAEGRSACHWQVDQNGYCAIGQALAVHDQQLGIAPQAEIRKADSILKARIAKGDVIRVSERN